MTAASNSPDAQQRMPTAMSPDAQGGQAGQPSPPGAPAQPAPPPVVKRRRWPWVLLALLLAGGAIALFAPGLSPEAAPTEGVSYVTEPARTMDLNEEIQADATVAYGSDAVSVIRSPRQGTVTAVHLDTRETPTDLEPAIEIDGEPVFPLASDEPLYRDLSDGDEGEDVEALEAALDDRGYDPGDVDDTFDWETAEAVRDWRDDHDLENTGVVERSWLLWLPPGSAVTDVMVQPGDLIDVGTEIVTAADLDDLVITAEVEQADIMGVDEDQDVSVDLDGADDILSGVVSEVPLEPGDAGTYPVTVEIENSSDLRMGVQGTASVIVDVRRDAVVVPTGAVASTDGNPTVQVLADGEPEDRPVELGLVTANGTEIVSGLSEGEQVILSQEEQ